MPFYFLQRKQLDSIRCCKIFTRWPGWLPSSQRARGKEALVRPLNEDQQTTHELPVSDPQPETCGLGSRGGESGAGRGGKE